SNYAGAVDISSRTKQGVDGRTEAVLFGTSGNDYFTVMDKQMTIGRSDIDSPLPNRLSIFRMRCLDRSGAAQQLRKPARRIRRSMLDDENGGWKIMRQSPYELNQRRDGACGASNNDDVP